MEFICEYQYLIIYIGMDIECYFNRTFVWGMIMQVIFKGEQNTSETVESLQNIIKLFRERYGICNFRELKLSMVLMDSQGDDIELVDSRTTEVFRVFEVYKSGESIKPISSLKTPELKLVVDNT